MEEREFFKKIREAGGRAYLVGGAVRDMLMGRAAHDRDYLVCGVAREDFVKIFPDARPAGRSFPVFLLEIGGAICEAALARVERKTGRGYAGFEAACAKEITVEQDLARRDTTINSMATDEHGCLIDPFGGAADIHQKIIRVTSAAHFAEDPVRALRAARQAAQFGFQIEAETLALMKECADELKDEPLERKFAELRKALASPAPSRYFLALRDAGLLSQEFPWIAALIGKTQPVEFHPEGDAFVHTMEAVDRAASCGASEAGVFAALMHDIGKGTTPAEMLPHHYGHEERGLEILPELADSLKIPKKWRKSAELVIKEHMRVPRIKTPGKIRDLLCEVEKSSLSAEDFKFVISADKRGKIPAWLSMHDGCTAAMKSASHSPVPAHLRGEEIGNCIRGREIAALKKFLDATRDNKEDQK